LWTGFLKVLLRNLEEGRQIGRPKRRRKNNIKTHLRGIRCEIAALINMDLDNDQWRATVNMAMRKLHVPQNSG
jgi:hypothetical protein